MDLLNDELVLVSSILLVLAGGVSVSGWHLHRTRHLRQRDQTHALNAPHLLYLASLIGLLAGLVIGALAAYYLFINPQSASVFAWIGRCSYVLIAWSAGGHLLSLAHIHLHLRREERAWARRGSPSPNTLGRKRVEQLEELQHQAANYSELKSRDEELVDQLVGFLGDPLTHVRHGLTRIPFYGYLGTVCGILLTAQELSQIDEATQTFKALSAMAEGLVLAFKTTLVGLLAYLPLRKIADYLVQRLAQQEDAWVRLRLDRQEEAEAGVLKGRRKL